MQKNCKKCYVSSFTSSDATCTEVTHSSVCSLMPDGIDVILRWNYFSSSSTSFSKSFNRLNLLTASRYNFHAWSFSFGHVKCALHAVCSRVNARSKRRDARAANPCHDFVVKNLNILELLVKFTDLKFLIVT